DRREGGGQRSRGTLRISGDTIGGSSVGFRRGRLQPAHVRWDVAAVSGVATTGALSRIEELLGSDASLLTHQCRTIPKDNLHLPGPDFVDRVQVEVVRSEEHTSELQSLRHLV